jgi:UDP-N-acetyl-2-amino-2-deoxyglucuronate dehydrogenase
MSRIRVGIIGCGVIAPTHVESYQAHPDVDVVWACDPVAARREALAARYGIPRVTGEAAEVFAAGDVDAVSICTDHASHAPLSVAALDAGKDVLCEKALASSREGLAAMLAAARRHRGRRVFGAVFQHRFEPVNRLMRRHIADGVLGRMLTAGVQMRCLRTDEYYRADRWRGTWAEEGGSVLINQAIHHIDQLQWQMGGAEAVTGFHANLTHGGVIETEDTAVAAVRFTSGALGTIEATSSSHIGWEPTLCFHGTEGSVELRHDRPAKVLFRDEARGREVREQLEAASRHDPQSAAVTAGKRYYGTGHAAQIADFLDAVRERREPFVTVESAAKTVELVFALYESHRSGRLCRL